MKKRAFPIAPSGAPAFALLADSRMYWPVQAARLQVFLREGFQAGLGLPCERVMLQLWKKKRPGSGWIESRGLPRRAVEHDLGSDLTLHIKPRSLLRMRYWRGLARRYRPSSSAFIWDSDWDLRRSDLLRGQRYRFINDIATHRDDLTRSDAFIRFNRLLSEGRPWKSHQQGVLLDSEARILTYLRVYLGFMDDMARHGFDQQKGKDALGVAVSRDGRLIKT